MTIDFAINPMTEEFRTHSAEYFSRLLKERPVARTELDQWLFCRYADVKRILINKEKEDKMARDEVIWTAVTMLIAGHETTTHMLGNGMLALINHPEQYRLLSNNPDLAANATEEILRFDPTLYVLFRESRADLEIGGQEIEAGSFLITSLYAANRDPEMFEQPELFDIRRENARQHLTFAAGRNLCLGHNLARLEGKVAFSQLFKKIGNLRLAGDPVPRNGLMFKGYFSLPMTWQAV